MTRRADLVHSRADFHAASGVLLVKRPPPATVSSALGQPPTVQANPLEGDEVLLAVWDDGSVTALHGHVDLGTGIRTALAQVVAEELDVELSQINMVLGNTASVPNQGATIASASLQIHAAPLRAAAAQARAWLAARASALNTLPTDYAKLLTGHVELLLDLATPLKPSEQHNIIGTSAPRVDIPAKATGALTFVHDMRVAGMLHGRVVRPPYAGADHGDFIGNTLQSVDEASVAHIPGIRAVVVIRDFVGIVAEREEHAEQALRELRVQWKPWPGMPDQSNLAEAIKSNPSSQRRLIDQGNVDMAMAAADQKMPRNYVWPYQLHASIGPSCALADWQTDKMTVWAGSQNPHVLRADLSRLMDLPDTQINVIRMEAAGCYGRNCVDDVAADAALLSRAVGAPVRVQLTREQESAWEPKGAAQLMQVNGGLNADGSVAAYDFQTSYPSNASPTLALLLTRTIEPVAQAFEMGDRTARPPYDYANLRVAVNDMAPMVRASWLRGVSALPNSFAHESYIDELATAAGVDPVEFRLRYLQDPRAVELLKATADKAGWLAHTSPQKQASQGDMLSGQGVGYARYSHSKWPGFGAAWAAWVADVEVNRRTGEVHVRRVVVGHDAGTLINPAGVQHQIHGNVVQTTSRALLEEVKFDKQSGTVANLEWGSYPILNFRDVPVIDIVTMPRQSEPPLGAGESSSVPGTAAIANAIFDATGVRFRQPPFTPEVVLEGLKKHDLRYKKDHQTNEYGRKQLLNSEQTKPAIPASAILPTTKKRWLQAGGVLAGLFGVAVALIGWRSVIAPVQLAAANIYSPATIERGRQLAALGNCVGCHTATDGVPNAGGKALDTPFGKIFSTNLTPDATGIGQWSLPAFTRAMREGISRDGHYLYPAFPYTSYAKTTDEDLTALYAYLMAQPAVASTPPETKLAFPYNIRPLMALWNGLFHDTSPIKVDTAQTVEWNRGNYLVNSLGHCGACHTPRNALGAEQGGQAYLAGAVIDGWEAPALTALSRAPVPWTATELYRYLRVSHTQQHGIAAGPMGDVVKELSALPDADIAAMASYLASFNQPVTDAQSQQRAIEVVVAAQQQASTLLGSGQRLFSGACGTCHHDGDGPKLLGVNPPLALNSNLHSARPDNLINIILNGVQEPATKGIGYMPAFKYALSDAQIAELASYMRSRYAPGQPAWANLPADVARLRKAATD
ncbi:MAG: molybdopterin cofactor-binding domain-containing protein [Polaromonas sp.]